MMIYDFDSAGRVINSETREHLTPAQMREWLNIVNDEQLYPFSFSIVNALLTMGVEPKDINFVRGNVLDVFQWAGNVMRQNGKSIHDAVVEATMNGISPADVAQGWFDSYVAGEPVKVNEAVPQSTLLDASDWVDPV